MYASSRGHFKFVNKLLESGADANAKNKNGNTALMLASGNGHSKVIKILFENVDNVNATYKKVDFFRPETWYLKLMNYGANAADKE